VMALRLRQSLVLFGIALTVASLVLVNTVKSGCGAPDLLDDDDSAEGSGG